MKRITINMPNLEKATIVRAVRLEKGVKLNEWVRSALLDAALSEIAQFRADKRGNRMKYKTLEQMTIQQSSSFLTEKLPDNYCELEREELHEFLRDNAWQPFENFPVEDVMEIIEDAAQHAYNEQPELPEDGSLTICFSPSELGKANVNHVANRVIDLAWEVIEELNAEASS